MVWEVAEVAEVEVTFWELGCDGIPGSIWSIFQFAFRAGIVWSAIDMRLAKSNTCATLVDLEELHLDLYTSLCSCPMVSSAAQRTVKGV